MPESNRTMGTPGPWLHDGSGRIGTYGEPVCCGNGVRVSEHEQECCGQPDYPMAMEIAQSSPVDADRIVHCVNCHDELLEALKELLDIIDQGDTTNVWEVAKLKARAALAKAGG
jgi:hypothetical protein